MMQYEPRRREVAAPVAAEPALPQAAPPPAPEPAKLTKRDLMGMTGASDLPPRKAPVKRRHAALGISPFTTCADAKLAICTEPKKDPPEWAKPKKKATAQEGATAAAGACAAALGRQWGRESPPPRRAQGERRGRAAADGWRGFDAFGARCPEVYGGYRDGARGKRRVRGAHVASRHRASRKETPRSDRQSTGRNFTPDYAAVGTFANFAPVFHFGARSSRERRWRRRNALRKGTGGAPSRRRAGRSASGRR